MNIFKSIGNVIVDAVFPLSKTEADLLSISYEPALRQFPKAPPPPISKASSIFAYKSEIVSKLIWQIKYKRLPNALKIGGSALYDHLLEWSDRPAIVDSQWNIVLIPMPITSRRRRERGYNQCELLLKEVEKLDRHSRFTLANDLLRRIHHASRQTLKDREHRILGAAGIFEVDPVAAGRLRSEKYFLIVIDDVITTGSTMKEAISTLEKAGFRNVRGISLAH